MTIPNSVTSIGEDAFHGCSSLTKINISDIAAWCNIKYSDKNKYNIWWRAHHLYLNGEEVKDLIIPDGITSIGDYAFYSCSGLTSVTIPNSVTSIGNHAFRDCGDVTSVTIPNSVTSIGSEAFRGCRGLTSMAIPNGVTSIGNDAFKGCSGLTSVTIPSTITSIGGSAFSDCSGLTSLTIPNSVTSIGDWAFSGCSGLTEIYIHNPTPPSTGRSSFDEQNYQNATLYVPEEAYDTYDNMTDGPWKYFMKLQSFKTPSAFYFDYYDNNMTAIVVGVKDNTVSSDIVIPETTTYNGKTYTVTAIGIKAFKDYSAMTSVTIPNSVTSIGKSAFEDCSGLTKVNISDLVAWCNIKFSANPLFYAHHLYLNGEEVTNLVIPDCITSIGNNVFPGCSGLTSVAIPNSVTSIGSSAFSGCSGLTSVTIPNSVTSIGRSAFHGCSGLTSVTIPNSVTSIGDYAFYNSGLTSVTIPNSVTSIGSYTFEYCSSLTEVTILNGVTSIGTRAFYDCSSLTSVTIPNSVTSIGFGAFWDCSGLTSVTIPNSVTSIGGRAFSGCGGLTEVYSLNPTPPSIGAYDNPFSDIYQKATLYVPKEALEAYRNAESWKIFQNIKSVESLILYYFDYDDSNMTATIKGVNKNKVTSELVIPETTTYNGNTYAVVAIGDEAFKGCEGLVSVTIPNSITAIGKSAFGDCSSLLNVYISDIASWCNIKFGILPFDYIHYLYLNGEMITNLVIPDGITTINGYAFYGCSGLTSVTIPNSVTAIGEYAFYGCYDLTEVYSLNSTPPSADKTIFYNIVYVNATLYVPNDDAYMNAEGWKKFRNINGLESSAFKFDYDNSNMTATVKGVNKDKISSELVIPETTTHNGKTYSVVAIGWTAFKDCSVLTSVTIPNSVTSIGSSAFSGCSGLTEVTIPDGVTSIGYSAFSGCSGLTEVTIPNSVTYIGNEAFYNCIVLTKVNISDIASWCNIEFSPDIFTMPHHLYINGEEVKHLVIPDGVTSIARWTFQGCIGFTEVTIPNSVTSIGNNAFSNCRGLTKVYSFNVTPPSASYDKSADDIYRNATLYVPNEAVKAYMDAEFWKEFQNIKGFDPTGIQGIEVDESRGQDVYYDLNGRRLSTPRKGLNIINGKKVIIK